jgi:hypothetical protein
MENGYHFPFKIVTLIFLIGKLKPKYILLHEIVKNLGKNATLHCKYYIHHHLAKDHPMHFNMRTWFNT